MPTTPDPHSGVRHGARGMARREDILRAALEVIAERGYRGASLAAVAEKAGLTQQGLLHYFPTKEDLLIGVLRMRDEWDSSPGSGLARTPEGLEALVEVNAARMGLIRTFSALLGESVTEDHPAAAYFHDRYEWARENVEETLRAAWGDELPRGLSPADAATLILAVMDGLQYQWLHEPDRFDMPAVFRAFMRLLDPGAEA